MTARDDIHRLFESGRTSYRLDEYLDAHRAERDAEIMRWLGKKAREYRATGRKADAERADLIGRLASQISRGAVRPNNTMLPAGVKPTFFEPGREYRATQHACFRFRCLATDTHPVTGEVRAFGWRQIERTDLFVATALDPDDWACCAWTDVTETGEPQ
ncbi:hypothetical protein [Streptomyces sp. BK340]|uniref:hypothetical protein n=1 Tax=Streptomyces sp. BK340 TaxID=2572903 RepID=UPI0011A1D6B4|nr:hypothetical protein [Streptomyces sp. BK340]TVZ96459.1 hypothetical protein FB157_103370 [Streptomyces sp. BK340]